MRSSEAGLAIARSSFGGSAPRETAAWNYDASNRITRGDTTGITIAHYDYDPAGRLWSIDAGGYDRRFLYAGAQAIGEYDGTGALVQRFVPGAGLDDYAAYTAGAGGGVTRQWPVTDPLGSVIGLTDGSAVATQINAYDEYGVPATGNAGRFGYAGALFTPEAGSAPWFMRNRQYHPQLGRFLQTDPIGYAGGVNLYAYVVGDPVNRIDPWGLQDGPITPNPSDYCSGPTAPLGCLSNPVDVAEIFITGRCGFFCRIQRALWEVLGDDDTGGSIDTGLASCVRPYGMEGSFVPPPMFEGEVVTDFGGAEAALRAAGDRRGAAAAGLTGMLETTINYSDLVASYHHNVRYGVDPRVAYNHAFNRGAYSAAAGGAAYATGYIYGGRRTGNQVGAHGAGFLTSGIVDAISDRIGAPEAFAGMVAEYELAQGGC